MPQISCVQKDGAYTMLAEQGGNGEGAQGRSAAKYRSDDRGKTWAYVEEMQPHEPRSFVKAEKQIH